MNMKPYIEVKVGETVICTGDVESVVNYFGRLEPTLLKYTVKVYGFECPSCEGHGGSTEDKWSYGANEGHYTIDHKCQCCGGEGWIEDYEEASRHSSVDGCDEPDIPEREDD